MSIYWAFASAWLYQRPPEEGPAQKEFDRGFDDGMQRREKKLPEDETLHDSYHNGYDAGHWRSDGGDYQPEHVD